MAKVEYWECDGCGKRKGPDNHWFAATANNATTCGPVWVVYLLANALSGLESNRHEPSKRKLILSRWSPASPKSPKTPLDNRLGPVFGPSR